MTKTIRRRRKQSKTDYKARLALLKSALPRLVIRKTNRYIIVQLVETNIAQDKVIASASSRELIEKGWPKENSGRLKNMAAAYLTGFLLVKKLKNPPKNAVLDIGMNRNIHGSRIYAALKGALEAGLNVSHNPDVLPSKERITSSEKFSQTLKTIKEKL